MYQKSIPLCQKYCEPFLKNFWGEELWYMFLNPGTVPVHRNRKQLKSLNLVEIERGKRVFRSVGVYVCVWGFDKTLAAVAKATSLSHLSFNPFSSAPPCHHHSHLLLVDHHYHSICPSLYATLSLHMLVCPSTVQKSRFASYSVSPSTQLFILMSAHLSFCLHTCAC